VLVAAVSAAKTAEPIEMPFGLVYGIVGPKNVLYAVPNPDPQMGTFGSIFGGVPAVLNVIHKGQQVAMRSLAAVNVATS